MTQANAQPGQPMKKLRKTYFPFKWLLRSQEFQGVGACLAENTYIQDGKLRKTRGQSVFKDTTTPAEILWMGEYEKSDGTFQILYAYLSGSIYLLRAIEENGTITTPTGGAGDVNFTSSNFDIAQLNTIGYVSNESATTPLYSWNGTLLTAISNAPASPKYVLVDGNRLCINKVFSGAITGTLTDFTAGTGAADNGDYAARGNPVGGVEAGGGVILMSKMGAELHKVIPNNASDDVSAKTKIQGFNYTGLGIQNTHQIVAGKNFVYFFNSDGIFEMNPFDGTVLNLTDTGNIERRWKELNRTNAFIEYDSKNDRVVVVAKQRGQNDTIIIVDTRIEQRPISYATAGFFSSIANVNNQLYGGSSHDARVMKIFDTFTDRDGGKLQFRYIIEWDALTNAMLEKRLRQFSIFANLNHESSFEAKLYKDGSHEPIATQTFTTTASLDSAKVGSVLGAYGKYVFNLGGGRDSATADLNTDKMQKEKYNTKCSTYTLEIVENSFYDFQVYDILAEYKTRGKITHSLSMANSLF